MTNSTKLWEEKAKDFLPKYSIEELQVLLNKEKDQKAKNRLRACILRKEGKTITQIVKLLRKPRTTVFDWLSKIQKFGLDHRYNKKQPGNKGQLSKENYLELEKVLEESPEKQGIPYKFWTNKLVQYFIKVKFKVLYGIRFVQEITKRLGFSLQKPRPKNPKASTKKQKEFVEMVKKIPYYLDNGFKVFCIDEVHCVMEPYHKRFLFKVGSKPTADYNYTQQRVSVYGALGIEDFYYETTEEYRIWENWLVFLNNLLGRFEKIVIVIDGAKYHFEKEHVQKFYEDNKDNLVVFQLPAYSPELNPIEQHWIKIKEHLANTHWFTKEEFKQKLIEGLETASLSKLFDYYTR